MTETMSDIPRRDAVKMVAKGLVGGMAVGTLASLSGSKGPSVVRASRLAELMSDIDAPAHYYNPDSATVYPDAHQVITTSNKRLGKLPSSKHAFVTVHSGFVSGQMAMVRERVEATPPNTLLNQEGVYNIASDKLGKLQSHDNRMARLLSAMSQAEAPVISFVDEPDLYNPHTPTKGLTPPPNALHVATLDSSPALAPDVQYRSTNHTIKKEPQDIEALYDGLHGAGVTTVYCAGEYSFNPDKNGPACLGGIALGFMDAGFEVRGINNAIYPVSKSSDMHNVMGLAEALYDDALPYNEAITLAKS